jgi:predicted ester cyclase
MTTSLETNKELVRNLYGTLMANGDTASADSILAKDYVDHSIPGLSGNGNREDLKTTVLGVRAAFPGIQPELYEILAEADLVSVRVEAGGTHTGAPFNGIPPTGKAIRWKEIHIFRCQNGKIVEHWGVFDLLSILQQLGAIPS